MKILAAEDDDAILTYMSHVISKCGHMAVLAINGSHAKDQFTLHEPKAVITDIKMPVLDGIALIKWLKEHHSQVPILVVSAIITESLEANLTAQGVRCLKKPFTEADLESEIAILTRRG